MKIGIVIIANGFAGAERVVHSLVESLIKNGVEVSLFINEGLVRYYQNIKKVNIVNIGKFSSKGLFNLGFSILNLEKNLFNATNEKKPDVVNLHSNTPFLIFYKKAKKKDLPFISTIHGTDIYDFFNCKRPLYLAFMKPRLKKIFEWNSKITSVSKHQIENLQDNYKKKTIVINNGVDINLFKKLKIKPKKNVVLFVGRYVDIKGINEVINVSKQLPEYEFWFAGEGPLKKMLNGKNIKELGFEESKKLVKLYNESTICIFPSYREGFPLVGLEAMACGKPVIATPLGFSEYIENGKDGLIIPAKNEIALKNAIVKLMENKNLRDKIGKNAVKKAQQYSWDNVAKKYIAVYKEAIENFKRFNKK